LVSLDQTFRRLSTLASNKLTSIVGQDAAKLLENFSSEIITTSKDLRNEPLGPEEGREQRVKNLIERKRRAWRDLLNELKRIGISPSPSPKTVARLEDAGKVYSLTPTHPLLALDSSALPGDVQVRLRKADAYHYRLLSELPTLKTYPATHNADVRTPDIQRALGHIQTGLNFTFDQRIDLIEATTRQVHLDRIINRIESASSSTSSQESVSALPLVKEVLNVVSQASEALIETREELSRYRSASDSPSDASTFASLVNEAISTLTRDQDRLSDSVATMGASDPVLSTADELTLISSSQKDLLSVVESLTSLLVPASLAYLHTPLQNFLASLSRAKSAITTGSTPTLSTLQSSHDNLISSILVVAQELIKLGNDEAKVSDGEDIADGGVLTAGRKLRSALQALRLNEMTQQVETFAREAHQALTDSRQVRFCSRLLFPKARS
jgi:midasin